MLQSAGIGECLAFKDQRDNSCSGPQRQFKQERQRLIIVFPLLNLTFSDYASLALEYLALHISYPKVIVVHVLGNKQEFKIKSSRIFCCFEI